MLAAPMPDAVPSGNPPIFTWSSVAGADHYCLLVIDQTTGQIAAIDPKITGASWTPSTPLTRGHNYVWYIGAYSTDGLAAAWSPRPVRRVYVPKSRMTATRRNHEPVRNC